MTDGRKRSMDADMDRAVTAREILDYCSKAADKYEEQLQRALSSDRNDANMMDAIAYFDRKKNLYQYEIPGIIYGMIFRDGKEQTGNEV